MEGARAGLSVDTSTTGLSIPQKLKAHINNVALHHTLFDLPYAFLAALLATDGHPGIWNLVWIALAITSGRAAALAMDNLVDLRYDKQQPRMSYRAMVKGEITPTEAKVFIIVMLGIMVLAVLQLARICIYLLPVAALPCLIYPYMKRVTGWVHMFLGLAIAMAPAGGWVGVTGEVTLPLIVLCTAVALWIGAFDAMYGAQDEEFDRAHGLHSLAVSYGARGAFRIASACHVLCIGLFVLLGTMLGLGALYYFSVFLAGCVLLYQHMIVTPTDFHRVTQAYFMRNSLVPLVMLVCTWIDFVMRA